MDLLLSISLGDVCCPVASLDMEGIATALALCIIEHILCREGI